MRYLSTAAKWVFGYGSLARKRFVKLFSVLILFNLFAWIIGYAVIVANPALLGLAGLAYSLGLRHAFDVDHIAAIDNVTRKFCLSGQRPIGVGFYFALGHSTIVIVLSAVVALAADYAKDHIAGVGQISAMISTSISAGFLTLLGLTNCIVLFRLIGALRARKGLDSTKHRMQDAHVESLLSQRGFFSRIFSFLFQRVSRSWHMYPIGILFGLGFATATESTILGATAALATKSNVDFWVVMMFPLLFTAGMTLMDTIDSFLMLRAYEWAVLDGHRRLFFNVAITGMGVVLALGIGSLEWLQIIAPTINLTGSFWLWLENLPFGEIGMLSVAIMVTTWMFAVIWYRRRFNMTSALAD